MTARAASPRSAVALGDDATIAAIATAPGRSALAIVRVSGSRAKAIAEALLGSVPTEARRAHYTTVRDEQGNVLDDVVATLFVAPHSFTGEDLLEISTHGGAVVPTMVLAAAIAAGARQAEPGEFTRRAVLNGRLDLIQAEAIGDLIDARSSAAHRVARRQLDGGLSTRIAELRAQLLALDALLAYDIDFPEEDDGPISRDRVAAAITSTEAALASLLATGAQGALVHEGALVVLAGAPNVGKSALFNALLGEARAIVTEVAGTTRDAIEAVLDLPGYPLRLVDTAGLRDTNDKVERLGIETSSRYLRRADVVLACADTAAALSDVSSVRELTDAPVITVATKADLGSSAAPGADVAVSAVTGAGMRELLQLIEKRLEQSRGTLSLDAPLLTRARHRAGVQRAHEELTAFRAAWSEGALPAVIAAAHVRAAADALSELIGVVQVDDVLDVVFRTFCVGK